MRRITFDEIEKRMKEEDHFSLKELYSEIIKHSPSEITKPFFGSKESYYLIVLYLFMGDLIHKVDMSKWVCEYLNEKITDAQVRHLSTQKGWYILNKGEIVPGTDEEVPSGYHVLIDINIASPRFSTKRNNNLSSKDFDSLKEKYDYKCSHCNSKEGEINLRDNKITKLQKGHIDPNKELTIDNIIPMCDYCNRTSKNRYIFHKNGAIKNINLKDINVAKDCLNEIIFYHGSINL